MFLLYIAVRLVLHSEINHFNHSVFTQRRDYPGTPQVRTNSCGVFFIKQYSKTGALIVGQSEKRLFGPL